MKRSAMFLTAFITIIVAGAVIWGIISIPIPLENSDDANEQIQSLITENKNLKEQLTDITAELDELKVKSEKEITHKPKDDWEKYFPEHDSTTLVGETINHVYNILGNPPVKIRNTAVNSEFNREIWIFRPYEEDPTGLYLYFKSDKLWRSQLDEFNGLYGSGLLQYEDFWLN